MKMRLAVLVVITALLSVFLVACGDDTAAVPTYSGATAITLSDSVKSQMTSSLGQLKSPTVEGFKTSDDVNKIKSTYDSSFKSAGWDDKSSQFTSDTGMQQLTGLGVLVMGYQKGNRAAVIMVLPGSFAGPLGFSGLSDGDNAIMVISGNPA